MKIEQIAVEPDRFTEYAYSAALAYGDLLLVAGQAAIGDDGESVGPGDFMAQAHQAFANLRRALQAGGSSLDDVLQVTVFFTDASVLPRLVPLRGTTSASRTRPTPSWKWWRLRDPS